MPLLRPRLPTLVGILLAWHCWLAPAAIAAPVAGSYQGVIHADSGLGLLGARLRIDFVYDGAVAGGSAGDESVYVNFLQAMTVSIGTQQWSFVPGGESVAFLADDRPSPAGAGIEDTFAFFSSGYTGPALVADAAQYTLSMLLIDETPAQAPDALASDVQLPALAPDPARFSADFNVIVFSFLSGTPDAGDYYVVEAGQVQSVVPLPATLWLLSSAVGFIGIVQARRARVQSASIVAGTPTRDTHAALSFPHHQA